jgi:hypothetical protein
MPSCQICAAIHSQQARYTPLPGEISGVKIKRLRMPGSFNSLLSRIEAVRGEQNHRYGRASPKNVVKMKDCFMKSPFRSFLATAIAALLLVPGLAGCVSKRSEMGVENNWRGPSPPVFEKGRSTQSDVMRALGPPSQVIGLQEQTLFYYLREQSRSKAVYLVVYNQTRQRILYDRAIFFFNKQGVLADFAYSKEVAAEK